MEKMPILFVGHGSPINAIEDNIYTRNWKEIAKKISKPKAIISFSAHWYTNGTKIMNEETPKTIYDMYGFPKELYEIVYHSPGNPRLATLSKDLIRKESTFDNNWGIDHGTWSVLVHMYPDMDIPVFQISIDASASPEVHYQIGKDLSTLREQGVLLFGTGNIVHNLRILNYSMENEGFDWAYEFNEYIKKSILDYKHDKVLQYHNQGNSAKYSVPTPDHFYPLLYILGAADEHDKISVSNDSYMMGSLSMTSYLFEA